MSNRPTGTTRRHRHAPVGASESQEASLPDWFAGDQAPLHPIQNVVPGALKPLLDQQGARFASIFGANIATSVASMSPRRLPPAIRGVIAGSPTSPIGFALVLDSSPRPVITSLWVSGSGAARARITDVLVRDVLKTRHGVDGLTEAQDLVFGAGDATPALTRYAVERHPRVFMDHTEKPMLTRELTTLRKRDYRHGDLLSVATLIQRSFQDTLDAKLNSEYRSLAGCLRRTAAAVSGVAWGPLVHEASLMVHDYDTNRLAGCLLMTDLGASHAHIVDVAVSPALAGRGIGRYLLESSLVRAREKGFERVSLCVSPGNRGAFALYQRGGFKVRREFNAFLLAPPRSDGDSASGGRL